MNLTPHLVIWGILAAALLILVIYRAKVAEHEDETIHVLESDAGKVSEQVALAKKLAVIDRWGKLLTVLVVVYGLVLVGLYLWNLWEQSSRATLG